MTDIKSPQERSQNMSRIHSKDTEPEEYFRKTLFHRGYRYRKNSNRIYGHPDAWIGKYDTALFVNGCFWHRHNGCKYAYTPKSRVKFWTDKFARNVERDNLVKHELLSKGIKVLVIWECTIRRMMKSKGYEDAILSKVEEFLYFGDKYKEL